MNEFVSSSLLLLHLFIIILYSTPTTSLSTPTTSAPKSLNTKNACSTRFLSKALPPTRLTPSFNATVNQTLYSWKLDNFSAMARRAISQTDDILGIITTKSDNDKYSLALNLNGRLRIFPNQTLSQKSGSDVDAFVTAFNRTHINQWGFPFKACYFGHRSWFYVFRAGTSRLDSVGFFFKLVPNRCDVSLKEIFNSSHLCDLTSTVCISTESDVEEQEQAGKEESDDDWSNSSYSGYRCECRPGFYHYYYNNINNFSWIQDHPENAPALAPAIAAAGAGSSGSNRGKQRIDLFRCQPCPAHCGISGHGGGTCDQLTGICIATKDVYLKTAILCIQLVCMAVTVVLALVVFKLRKTKSIASGMWTILETILLGILILYCTVVVKFFEPSVLQCLLEPWAREVGFIICYGAIILKLYRHLIEFRTRKAHRWVVKDTDLLKYLLIMVMSVLAYMAAFTSITLNFMQENYSLLYVGQTLGGWQYAACKALWWDYVTEAGEIVILIFGIHLSYASRNARTQFHERNFLCAAISIELAVSTIFYVGRVFVLPGLHPDVVLIIYCLRTQLSTTLTLLLVFVPKFWYQHKQVRSLGQEYSCRIPVDAFKDGNAHGPLTGNNSDVELGEVTLADMNPEDIRAELKRLYLQVEMFKSKTICRDNPHISKRRGGRKAQHRRFSLQNLHNKQRDKHHHKHLHHEVEVTECEPSRTPEDSVCSNEGPSAIFADLPSTATQGEHK